MNKRCIYAYTIQCICTLLILFLLNDPVSAELDFSTEGPFSSLNMIKVDQKTPRQLGFDDVPILSDIWGWTDSVDGTEYVIVASDARHVPVAISGEDQVASLYNPVGGVAFARLSPAGEILPLGVWRHPTVEETDHGDIQVFGDYAYVIGENPGYGLVVFDMTLLRDRIPCESAEKCALIALHNVPDFGVVVRTVRDLADREISISNAHNLTIDEESGFMAIHAASTVQDDEQGKIRPKSTKLLLIDADHTPEPILLVDLKVASHDGLIVRYQGPDIQHQGKIILLLANGYKHFFIDANPTEVVNNPKAGPSIYQLTQNDGQTVSIRKLSLKVTYENDNFGHQLALSEDHKYVFFNDEEQFQRPGPAKQIVFGISVLKRPVELFQCHYSVESISHDGYVIGDLLVNGNYTSGVRVVDVSSVEGSMCVDDQLDEIAYFDTEPRLDNFSQALTFELSPEVTLQAFSDFAGVWGNYPYFSSGYIIASDVFNGVFSLKLDLVE